MAIKILNKHECDVTRVNYIGDTVYYCRGFWDHMRRDIEKIIVINSNITRRGNKEPKILVNIDIYTSDARVIEVETDDKRFLELCKRYITFKDPRMAYRKERGVI